MIACLMEKGVIIGVEHESINRATLPFTMFRNATSVRLAFFMRSFRSQLLGESGLTIQRCFNQTHLFLHHVLRHQLQRGQLDDAVAFASNYQSLVFFSHALEVLLHMVLEAEPEHSIDNGPGLLSVTIEFIDHFDASLDVVVGCARKMEMSRWRRLFDVVGNPKDLFEVRRLQFRIGFDISFRVLSPLFAIRRRVYKRTCLRLRDRISSFSTILSNWIGGTRMPYAFYSVRSAQVTGRSAGSSCTSSVRSTKREKA